MSIYLKNNNFLITLVRSHPKKRQSPTDKTFCKASSTSPIHQFSMCQLKNAQFELMWPISCYLRRLQDVVFLSHNPPSKTNIIMNIVLYTVTQPPQCQTIQYKFIFRCSIRNNNSTKADKFAWVDDICAYYDQIQHKLGDEKGSTQRGKPLGEQLALASGC